MADKKPEKKDDKKAEKKDSGMNPELKALYWVIGIIIFLSFFLTNFNGTFFSTNTTPIEDAKTGKVVGTDRGFKFPTGTLAKGVNVVLKNETFVRSAPAQSLLGKQKQYETATIQEGPLQAFNQNWWRLNFENAPDGWVPEYSFTSYVGLYKTLHIIPITWIFIKPILWIISIALFILLMAAKIRLKALRSEAEEKLKSNKQTQIIPSRNAPTNHIVVDANEEKEILTAGDRRSNERWMHILQLLQSHNQNDWRQSIIEADIVLEEMLDKMGYEGNSIGDKLKGVESSDFRTIQQAWEAHKVRNRIAHMGSEFQISRSEVEKTINLYQEVFEEFYYI